VAEVRGRIADAAARSGRTGDAITLVAVSKYVGVEEVLALLQAGCSVLGESRPQQFWPKAEAVAEALGIGKGDASSLPQRAAPEKGTGPIDYGDPESAAHELVPSPFQGQRNGPVPSPHWHMIGPLQRNKVRRTLPLVEVVQSADSPRLIATIDRVAGELSSRMPILLQVNVSGEAAKQGFEPADVEPFLNELAEYPNIETRGLMCMAGLGTSGGGRRDFAALREVRDRLGANCPEGISLDELSMGMSGDYETAIEEGATMVRVGSALFRGVR